jgi:spore maturation protein B
VPTTAVNILATGGSHNASGIVGSTLIATTCATVSAIVAVKLLERQRPFQWETQPQNDRSEPAPSNADSFTESEKAAVDSKRPPLARWGRWALIAIGLFFVTIFVPRAFPYWFGNASPSGFLNAVAIFFNALSPLAIPFLLLFFPINAAARGIPIYAEFVEGAKEGFTIAIRIIPYLVGMLVAIAVFRDSGALGYLQDILRDPLRWLQFPVDLLPMVLMRPLSGSGSMAVLTDLVRQFGPDNILSYMAATIYGSAETTFYVVAIYFGSVGVTRTRHAIPAGLIADLISVIAAVAACRLLFR